VFLDIICLFVIYQDCTKTTLPIFAKFCGPFGFGSYAVVTTTAIILCFNKHQQLTQVHLENVR